MLPSFCLLSAVCMLHASCPPLFEGGMQACSRGRTRGTGHSTGYIICAPCPGYLLTNLFYVIIMLNPVDGTVRALILLITTPKIKSHQESHYNKQNVSWVKQ